MKLDYDTAAATLSQLGNITRLKIVRELVRAGDAGMPVGEMFAEVGAEIVVATPQVEVLEGEWPGNWTVVVKVPSAEIARALYHSEKYAPFRKARQEVLANATTLVIAPGL